MAEAAGRERIPVIIQFYPGFEKYIALKHVAAKVEIYNLMNQLKQEGVAVMFVSSEMPELLGVCDRILVMSGGKLAGEVDAGTATQEEIMTLAAKYV